MRPSRDEVYTRMAVEFAQRSTCVRRSVACVLVDVRGDFLAMGHNGVASNQPHCNEGRPCPGAEAASGADLHMCRAIHAEANALIRCRDPWSIDTAYCTTFPCADCVDLLLNTSCRRIVFLERYPRIEESIQRWQRSRRVVQSAAA